VIFHCPEYKGLVLCAIGYNEIMLFLPVYIFVFIFGAIIGSFLNVVILRWNSGKTVLGRSGCFSCGKELKWYELFPIFSFLFLNGKCSSCKARISIQYPLVELASGLLFVFLFVRIFDSFDFVSLFDVRYLWFALSCVLWSSLLVVAVYDIRHQIIPNFFSLVFFITAILITWIESIIGGNALIRDHIFGALIVGGFLFLVWLVTRGRGMGFGDVKLAVSIGLYLGVAEGLSAMAFAFWIGAVYALTMLGWSRYSPKTGKNQLSLAKKQLTMKSKVPFGPFLIIGTFLALAFGSDIFHIALLFNV
jgi:leader peptidase (prepilin peptidase) / N-methyltransferase